MEAPANDRPTTICDGTSARCPCTLAPDRGALTCENVVWPCLQLMRPANGIESRLTGLQAQVVGVVKA